MSNNIPSPMSLDLTNTRAFKIWLYQLWQATGGTTTTAIDDIDVYLADSTDQKNTAQSDQSLLMQIRNELAEINKNLEQAQIRECLIVDEVNQKFDELQIRERLDRTILDDVNKRFDELRISERQTIEDINKIVDELIIRERTIVDELSRKIDDVILLLGAVV